MTIQEALKSGNPFKRKNWKRWKVVELKQNGMFYTRYFLEPLKPESRTFAIDDILADDWEVKE